jgi:predicted PurR-regulated permease PerM
MTINNENLVNKINTYFENTKFNELYSNDIWFTIIIFIVVIFVALYFFIIGSIKSHKNSWQKNKCNPLFMPFASVINSEDSKGKELDYTINNFNECLNTLNAELAQEAKKPIDNIGNSIEGIYASIHNAFIEVQKFIVYLFNLLLEVFKMLMDKLSTILIHIKLFFLNTNEFLRKILSSITVVFYTLTLLIKSFRLVFVVFVLGWLLTMVIPASMAVIGLMTTLITVIIIFSQLMGIPFIGWILAVLLVVVIVAYTIGFVVAVIFLIIVSIMYVIFNKFVQKIFPE